MFTAKVSSQESRERLQSLTVSRAATILQGLQAIDRGVAGLALVVTPEGQLAGVVTDGDLRRALIAGATVHDPLEPYVRSNPVTVSPSVGRAHVLDLMRARRIGQIPVVNHAGSVIGLHLLTDVVTPQARPNLAVVMAGGRGQRLGAITDNLAKPMVPVAGRPILEWIILHLVHEGIRDVVISVGYLADQITDHFGEGSQFGCRIRYVWDDPTRSRGSAGALADVPASWAGEDCLLVMNGDLLAQFDLERMLDRHTSSKAVITMATRNVVHEVAFGVVEADERGIVTQLREKPQMSWTVNAGIYLIEPTLLTRVPSDRSYPMTELIETCLASGETVAAWPLVEDWVDIGQPLDLARARGQIR